MKFLSLLTEAKMNEELLYIVMQSETKNSFWTHLIYSGISEAAGNMHDNICAISFDDLSYDLSGRHVIVVGNNIDWIEAASVGLMRRGAFPLIANACMLPVQGLRCSGVTFELEEMLERCIGLLADAGRKRTVLLGVNPNSIADRVKADFFAKSAVDLQPGDIIWSPQSLDECVERFVDSLSESSCDAVICSNDTVAIRLVHRLSALGYRLPEQLYIVGMGNSYVGANLGIGLTSIMFDYREMGRMSVQLYHDLIRRKTPCHMTVSLPCRLIVRHSAPLSDKPSAPKSYPEINAHPSVYFEGNEVQNIIRIENILQSCDAFDREIIFGITRGETCDMISERLFFSGRAVRYRLAKIIRQYGFSDRSELEASVRRALNG